MACNGTNSTQVCSGDLAEQPQSLDDIVRIRITVYIVCLLLGVVGNGVVVAASVHSRRYISTCRLLLAHLALTDAVFVLRLPMQIQVELNHYHWVYGTATCKLLYGVTSASGYASIATITAIAFERYKAVMSSVAYKWTTRRLVVIVVGIWTLSLAFYSPYMYALNVFEESCYDVYPSVAFLHVYTVSLFTVKFIIPLGVMGYCYGRIIIRLRQRSVSSMARTSVSNGERRIRSTSKIIKTLLVVVLAFIVCTLPSSLWWLWYDFSEGKKTSDLLLDILEVFAGLAYLHAGLNPIIYAIMDRQFRSDVRNLFSSKAGPDPRRMSTSSFTKHQQKQIGSATTMC